MYLNEKIITRSLTLLEHLDKTVATGIKLHNF